MDRNIDMYPCFHIQFTDLNLRVLWALYYLSLPPVISSSEKKQLDIASRYWIIDDLANPIIQASLYCAEFNRQDLPILFNYILYLYDYGIYICRNQLCSKFPDSMLVATLELDPINNPNITLRLLMHFNYYLMLNLNTILI